MSKKLLSSVFFVCFFTTTFSQSKYSINFQVSPAITFFKAYDPTGIFMYKSLGRQKNSPGISYSLELEKTLGKNWSLAIGNSRMSYLVSYDLEESISGGRGYSFDGSLRQTHSYFTATVNKKITFNPKNSFSIGLGGHLVNIKNQYFEISQLGKYYTFYEYWSTEGGMQFQVNYERKIKENILLGFNSRLYYIISVDSIDDLVFGPYLKVNL